MIQVAKYTVILFAVFLIGVGFLMLIKPEKARHYLRKAASTNLINYTEITIRMIPAAAMVICAEISKFPEFFKLMGWFMIATSVVLYFVPRRLHHRYALYCADMLTPNYIRLASPFSMFLGGALIYAIV